MWTYVHNNYWPSGGFMFRLPRPGVPVARGFALKQFALEFRGDAQSLYGRDLRPLRCGFGL